MKVILLDDYGPVDNLRVGEVGEVADPVAGPGEVVVRVAFAGLRWGDVMSRNGIPRQVHTPPFVPGQEATGVVHAVGEGVDDFAVGDRVMAVVLGGAYAELLKAPARALTRVPERVGLDSMLAYGVNFPTAWLACTNWGAVADGDRVLLHAAAGGVGLLALQILTRRIGARVIAVVGSDHRPGGPGPRLRPAAGRGGVPGRPTRRARPQPAARLARTAAVLPLAEQGEVAVGLVGWSSFFTGSPVAVTTGATYDIQFIAGLQYLVDEGLLAEGDAIGHIYFTGDYGENGLRGSTFAAEELGLEVIEASIDPGTTDLTTEVQNFQEADARAIVLGGAPPQLTAVVNAQLGLDYDVPVLGQIPAFQPSLLATPASLITCGSTTTRSPRSRRSASTRRRRRTSPIGSARAATCLPRST